MRAAAPALPCAGPAPAAPLLPPLPPPPPLLLPRRTLRASALGLRLRVPARSRVAPPATKTQQHEAEVSAVLPGSSRIPPTLHPGVPGVGGRPTGGLGAGGRGAPRSAQRRPSGAAPGPRPALCVRRLPLADARVRSAGGAAAPARKPLCASRAAGPASGSLTSRSRVLGQVAPRGWGGTQKSHPDSRRGTERLGLGVPKEAL